MTEWTVMAKENGYVLSTRQHRCPCLVGRSGLLPQTEARGRYGDTRRKLLRRAYYRPDRLDPPVTGLPLVRIHESLGWCDDPSDPAYNRAVELPFAAGHETMFRDDALYDIVVELGYNDAPPVAGLGSAIFLHLREAHTLHTAGCVAVTQDDMLAILAEAGPETVLRVVG